jgi:hypothetical protein
MAASSSDKNQLIRISRQFKFGRDLQTENRIMNQKRLTLILVLIAVSSQIHQQSQILVILELCLLQAL